jgi:hypothetical protein
MLPMNRTAVASSAASSTPQLIDSIAGVSGILDRPLSQTMTIEIADVSHAITDILPRPATSHARDFARYFSPFFQTEGVGNAGCPVHPQRKRAGDLPDGASEIFFARGLDRNSGQRVICPTGYPWNRDRALMLVSSRQRATFEWQAAQDADGSLYRLSGHATCRPQS